MDVYVSIITGLEEAVNDKDLPYHEYPDNSEKISESGKASSAVNE